MAFKLFDSKGTPVENQRYTWRDMVRKPLSKLDDDAFTRVRVILMNGIERESIRFQHSAARFNRDLQLPLALVRRSEQHQATMIGWLIGADHSPLETSIAHEQAAIELTAAVARREPDPYLAQCYRFGLLEDFDHLYRYSALLDRLEGKDPNNILQSYTDIVPGRPTRDQHRDPEDCLRNPYERKTAAMLSKLHALTVTATEQQAHDYYMNVGPLFADPVARQLYAEIASIEEQHLSQYESMLDPTESWLEKWVLHEANECYNYYSMVESEPNHDIKAVWERFLDYELGHFHAAAALFQQYEGRDAAEIVTGPFADPIPLQPQRDFYRQVLAGELDLRAEGARFVPQDQEPQRSRDYRAMLHGDGEPSGLVSAGYVWAPGTELTQRGPASGATIATGTMAAALVPAAGITRH